MMYEKYWKKIEKGETKAQLTTVDIFYDIFMYGCGISNAIRQNYHLKEFLMAVGDIFCLHTSVWNKNP